MPVTDAATRHVDRVRLMLRDALMAGPFAAWATRPLSYSGCGRLFLGARYDIGLLTASWYSGPRECEVRALLDGLDLQHVAVDLACGPIRSCGQDHSLAEVCALGEACTPGEYRACLICGGSNGTYLFGTRTVIPCFSCDGREVYDLCARGPKGLSGWKNSLARYVHDHEIERLLYQAKTEREVARILAREGRS